MLNVTLQILGVLFLGIIAIALVLGMFGYLVDSLTSFYDRWKYNHQIQVIHQIGQSLSTESYWLSEDPKVMKAVQCIGKYLSKVESPYVMMSTIRDEINKK